MRHPHTYTKCLSYASFIQPLTYLSFVRPLSSLARSDFARAELQELLPGIINELGSENLDNLKEIAGNFGGAEAAAADDDDDVPDLVENFEEASK